MHWPVVVGQTSWLSFTSLTQVILPFVFISLIPMEAAKGPRLKIDPVVGGWFIVLASDSGGEIRVQRLVLDVLSQQVHGKKGDLFEK